MNLKKILKKLKETIIKKFKKSEEFLERYEEAKKESTFEVNRVHINHVTHCLKKYKAERIQDYDINYTSRLEELIEQLHVDVFKDVIKRAETHRDNACSMMEQQADIDFIRWCKEVY